LGTVDHFARHEWEVEELTLGRSTVFGLFQNLALIPGVSRSGITITDGRLLGFNRPAAAEFTFLIALPAMFASGLYKMLDIGEGGYAGCTATLVLILVLVFTGVLSPTGGESIG
jgi:undecaprenyl-diphosphatase